MQHYDAVEASLLAEYRIDLGAALYGKARIGARRLWSLISNLSPKSALHRALDPEGWHWSQTDELLATIVEEIDQGNRMFHSAHRDEKSKTWDPIRVPRPKPLIVREPEPRRMSTIDELKAFVWGGDEV